MSAEKNSSPDAGEPKKPEKPRIEKPDAMSADTLRFIAGIDDYKRRHMLPHLTLEQVLEVVHELDFVPPKKIAKRELAALTKALDEYKQSHGRLFPNWSEVFSVIAEMGYTSLGEAA